MHHRGQQGYTISKSAKTQGSQQLTNPRDLNSRQHLGKSSACRNRNVNSNRPIDSPWIFCLRDWCLPENFIAGTFLFPFHFYTWSNRVRDGQLFWPCLKTLVNVLSNEFCKEWWKRNYKSFYQQWARCLHYLFSFQPILSFNCFCFCPSPLQYFVPAKKGASLLLLPLKVLRACCW